MTASALDLRSVAVVAPVHRNGATLAELARRVGDALDGRPWSLHLVVDACPDSATVARALAAADPRVVVTVLEAHVGQHRAIATGLDEAIDADAWVVLDADLQDPPEAIPALLAELPAGCADGCRGHAVFAGRRGDYEGRGRLLTGRLHRATAAALTGLPIDAGAFVAVDRPARDLLAQRVLHERAPSVVVAATGACRAVSVPVVRAVRPAGRSAWTTTARLRQSVRTLSWSATHGRYGDVLRQFAGFLVVGGVATLGYLALYELLRAGLAAEPANVVARVAFAIGTTWANARWVFRSRTGMLGLLGASALSLCVGIVLTDIPLALEQQLLGPDQRVAEACVLLVATALATLVRFGVLRLALRPAPAASVPTPALSLVERKTAP